MTTNPPDRWAIASVDKAAVKRAHEKPGERQSFGQNAQLPAWALASVVWDIDGVMLLEVLSLRPGRNPRPVLLDLSDQLVALGWRQQAWGPLPWNRPEDGVCCPGCWATWERVEVERG